MTGFHWSMSSSLNSHLLQLLNTLQKPIQKGGLVRTEMSIVADIAINREFSHKMTSQQLHHGKELVII